MHAKRARAPCASGLDERPRARGSTWRGGRRPSGGGSSSFRQSRPERRLRRAIVVGTNPAPAVRTRRPPASTRHPRASRDIARFSTVLVPTLRPRAKPPAVVRSPSGQRAEGAVTGRARSAEARRGRGLWGDVRPPRSGRSGSAAPWRDVRAKSASLRMTFARCSGCPRCVADRALGCERMRLCAERARHGSGSLPTPACRARSAQRARVPPRLLCEETGGAAAPAQMPVAAIKTLAMRPLYGCCIWGPLSRSWLPVCRTG
jgi:hypothetical protein